MLGEAIPDTVSTSTQYHKPFMLIFFSQDIASDCGFAISWQRTWQ